MREESSVSFLDSLPGPLQRGPGRESKNTSVDFLAHQSIGELAHAEQEVRFDEGQAVHNIVKAMRCSSECLLGPRELFRMQPSLSQIAVFYC